MPIRKHPAVIIGLGFAGIALWLGAWQWFTTAGPLSGVAGLPTATDTLTTSFDLLSQSTFWGAVADTLYMAVIGLVVAIVLGVVLGVTMGLSKLVDQLLDPTIQFLRPVPPVVLLPLVLLIVGPTPALGVALASFAAVWPILTQTLVGVRSVDPVALETARSMRISWTRTQTRVVLPSSLPSIATGVRIAGSSALMLAVGVGLLAGAPGLGRLILLAQQTGQSTLVFAIIIWSGVLGLLVSIILTYLERALTRGHRPTEAAQ